MYSALDNQMYNIYNHNTIFNVAVYCRLSREDVDKGLDVSQSITNQKELLLQYIEENSLNLVDIYIDDDYTGTNFDRPDFKRMIADIEYGRVNMVITKDFSRLGRDHVETGHYIEKYFLLKNIRYVAIMDSYDSFTDSLDNNITPFKLILNDMYSADISKKVRATFGVKKQKGEFIGSFAPYGYKMNPDNKGQFIIDENVVDVVRRIFDMYVNGSTYANIARILTTEGVTPPGLYKRQTTNFNSTVYYSGKWSNDTVRKILTNPTYIGCMVQNKSNKINYKINKFRAVPKELWTIVPNRHEPIISQEVFDIAQLLAGKNNVKKQTEDCKHHILSGLVYCGECGQRMTFDRNNKTDRFDVVCYGYKRNRNCTSVKRNYIPEKEVEEFVLNELKQLFKKHTDKNSIMKSVRDNKISVELEGINKEEKAYLKELDTIQNAIRSLYKDKLKEVVTDKDYMLLSEDFNKERETWETKLYFLQQKKTQFKRYQSDNKEILKAIDYFLETEILSKATLNKLISRIELFSDKSVKIYSNFKCD